MFGFDTWIWVLVIASTIASTAVNASNARAAKNQKQQAIQDYYNQLQQSRQQYNAFASSKASSKSSRMNAQKYSLISESLVTDATRREGESQKAIEHKRPLKQLFKDFGNKYAAGSTSFSGEEKKFLLAKNDFGEQPEFTKKPDFLNINFDVEKFNTNYFKGV